MALDTIFIKETVKEEDKLQKIYKAKTLKNILISIQKSDKETG